MNNNVMDKYGVDQISYWVEDVDAACEHFAKTFGAGPFLKMGPLHFEKCVYRGKEVDPETIIALGMWGPIQVEFVQKTNDEPHLFDEYGYGFNHINVTVDDYDAAIKELQEAGYEVGMEMVSSGAPIAYMKTMTELGHCIEVHGPNKALDLTKMAAAQWDGKDVYIDLKAMMANMGK